jgi:hypothetical protein
VFLVNPPTNEEAQMVQTRLLKAVSGVGVEAEVRGDGLIGLTMAGAHSSCYAWVTKDELLALANGVLAFLAEHSGALK